VSTGGRTLKLKPWETLIKLREGLESCHNLHRTNQALAPAGLLSMNSGLAISLLLVGLSCATSLCGWSQGTQSKGCKLGVVEGELEAGRDFRQPIGNGLAV